MIYKSQLRRFLEQLLQRRYLENVPAIVPLLEREYRCAARRLEATQEELNDLHPDKLKDKGKIVRTATGLDACEEPECRSSRALQRRRS